MERANSSTSALASMKSSERTRSLMIRAAW
jgi:hypothetical protein